MRQSPIAFEQDGYDEPDGKSPLKGLLSAVP